MRPSLRGLAIVLGLVALSWCGGRSAHTWGKESLPPTFFNGPMRIAVVDFGKACNADPVFIEQSGALKIETALKDNEFRARRTKLELQKAQATKLDKRNPSYNALKLTLAQEEARLNVEAQNEKDRLDQQKYQIYLTAGRRTRAAIAAYSSANNIQLVLRAGTYSSDLTDPKQIMEILNRQVVRSEQLDITSAIVAQVAAEPAAP